MAKPLNSGGPTQLNRPTRIVIQDESGKEDKGGPRREVRQTARFLVTEDRYPNHQFWSLGKSTRPKAVIDDIQSGITSNMLMIPLPMNHLCQLARRLQPIPASRVFVMQML